MSIPIYSHQMTFDEFLFVLALSQCHSHSLEQKYDLLRRVDERLIEFLKYPITHP